MVDAIDVVVRGEIPDRWVDYARRKVAKAVSQLDEPILHTRLRLSLSPDPAVERPAVAQVNVDVNGEPVRAGVSARDVTEAADLLAERLRRVLVRRHDRRDERHVGLPPEPGRWGHGRRPSRPRSHIARPPEEREVVPRQTFAVGLITPDEAAFDLEMFDHDFILFTDLASGEDCVLSTGKGEGYVLWRLHAPAPQPPVIAQPLTIVDGPAPVLALADAIERLNAGKEPFVFFEDAGTGRGRVLYRRFDGHYGLITPEGTPAEEVTRPGVAAPPAAGLRRPQRQ